MIAGLILAGGASRRMGRPKALLEFQNETFLGRLQRIFLAHTDPLVVVLGHDTGAVRQAVDSRVLQAINQDPERGMLSSLQTGLEFLKDAERVLFLPLDYPAIHEETVAALCAAAMATVVMPRFEGRRGHPVLISQSVVRQLLALPLEGAARDVIRSHNPTVQYVDVNDPAILMDVDTPEDYRALLRLP